jgi:uncharacterized protein (UPF0218 family)
MDDDAEQPADTAAVVVTLPADARDAFKTPMGPVTTDPDAVAADAARTRDRYDAPDAQLVAVGDVVTYHLSAAGHRPDVAVVDGYTERAPVRSAVEAVVDAGDERVIEATNPPGTLTDALLAALTEALDDDGPVTIRVDGEEDLATLPAILVARTGATVVYGQPGEGIVRVAVTPENRRAAQDLFDRLEGDAAAAETILGVASAGEDGATDERASTDE